MKSALRFLRSPFITLGFALAGLTMLVPLQRFISLGRYQHYGISIFLFGLGYGLHCLWNWRALIGWSRACYLATAAFFCSVGIIFWANPWMDSRTGVATDEQNLLRQLYIGVYLVLGFLLVATWLFAYLKSAKDDKV
ncbi:MAG TPA: hypothetical protein V6C97_26070 [Oculatellaceae cyanobacterium]